MVLGLYFLRFKGRLSAHGLPKRAPLGHLWDPKSEFITSIFRSGFPGGPGPPKRSDLGCFWGVFGECFGEIFLGMLSMFSEVAGIVAVSFTMNN